MSAARKPHHDDEDVKTALAKTDTADGSGFDSEDELPESDFDGHAPGVENDHDGDNVGEDEK